MKYLKITTRTMYQNIRFEIGLSRRVIISKRVVNYFLLKRIPRKNPQLKVHCFFALIAQAVIFNSSRFSALFSTYNTFHNLYP